VTAADPPPGDKGRILARPPVSDSPPSNARATPPVPDQHPLAFRLAPPAQPAQPARNGPVGPKSMMAGSAMQGPRNATTTLNDLLKSVAETRSNGMAGTSNEKTQPSPPPVPQDAPAQRSINPDAHPLSLGKSAPSATRASLPRSSMSYLPDSERGSPSVGEPHRPIAERQPNGFGTDPMDRPITPRSPRTALEPESVEVPTRRSKSVRHPVVMIGNAVISLFVLVAVVAGFGLLIGKQRFEAPGPLPQDKVVLIPRGSGIRDITDVLVREGVIDQPWVFVGGVLVLKARDGLKAGEYQFKKQASLRDVVDTIIDGKVVMHQVTVAEGLTSEQIVAKMLDNDVLGGNIKEIPREGSLLPDTYNFARGFTREQLIQRMQQSEQRLVKDVWDRRAPDLPIKTPEQLVILASLIEKETSKPEERTRVAAVFVNRLKQKMKLQADPTIIYGLVGGKGTLGRPILKSEIEQPTPYNTYVIDGLPPGPIDNPGRAALEAAANPARTRELYFVADGTGGHAFAESYEQHQKNVTRLRQSETEQKDSAGVDNQSPPPAAAAPPAAAPAPAPAPARAPARRSQRGATR
jgi:UPF0755 protein